MNYKETCKQMQGHNLADLGRSYGVNWQKVKELDDDAYERLADSYDIWPEEGEWVWLTAYDIDDLDIPYEAVDWSDCLLEEEEQEYVWDNLIKKASSGKYLVYASGCRWDGADGYKIADSPSDAVYREYDVTITPESVSKGGKVLACRESSHDVPMGSTTYIISLTEKEYEKLDSWLTEFADVQQFVAKCTAAM